MTDDDPFDDLPGKDADGDADLDAAVDELFSEVQVEAIDDEAVWDALTAADDPAGPVDGNGAGEPADADAAERDDEGEGTVVPKGSYCQQCPHFSPPPQVTCDHPGTEILELVDVEHFRVTGCPIVERRHSATRDLGDED